MQGPLDNAV